MNTPTLKPQGWLSQIESLAARLARLKYVRDSISVLLERPEGSFRYTERERILRALYRKISPVPTSPWTKGHVNDIGEVHLVPPEQLRSFFGTCMDTLRKIKGHEMGDYLEFGVFNGSSMGSMVQTARARNDNAMRFFGFDAFEGLPPGSDKEDGGVWEPGFYKCSFEEMRRCLMERDVNPDDINWINGWYDETLTPEMASQNGIDNVGIAFIDCDTYSSSKKVLEFLGPLLTRPAILCFDDWKLNDLDIRGQGEYRSFNEFLEANPHLTAREILSYNRKSKSFLVRPKE